MFKRLMYTVSPLIFLILTALGCATLTDPFSKENLPTQIAPGTLERDVVPTSSVRVTPDNGSSTANELDRSDLGVPTSTATPEKVSDNSDVVSPPDGPVTWPSPLDPLPPLSRVAASDEQWDTRERLLLAEPPERDDLEILRLYGGWDGVIDSSTRPAEPLQPGTIQSINVLNHDTIMITPIEAELLAIGENAYFWFDRGPGSIRPSERQLAEVVEAFDEIYERSVAIYGPENKPGVDGDPRIHVVTASPLAICDVDLSTLDTCSLAGYFSSFDSLPPEADPDSNGREMFVMNASYFGTGFYLNVLTHELRHMIEDNYDRGDEDWVVEGGATLAEELVGLFAADNGVSRANLFLQNPDQQLNSWTDGYTIPYYGQGYLLNRYIHDRLGPDFYRQFAASQGTGLKAINEVARINGQNVSGEGVWLDWLAALAIHDNDDAAEVYQFSVSGLQTAAMTEVELYPADFTETVHQYAADYYRLAGDEDIVINFIGSTLVPPIDTVPASGETMWLANRTNFGHMQLSREFDLTNVETATFQYDVYHDIELGYDFAYVYISADDGATWQPLVADNMQGLQAEDDPSDSALADRFYSGRSDGWQRESIDLTPFVGQKIQLRFAYLTDLILTFGGLALDNIAVPEIGFFDDVETDGMGWEAEGFERVTAAMPQKWHLQLVTYENGRPVVQPLTLDGDQTLSLPLSLAESDDQAILIVAASAPMTLEQAHYQLSVIEQ